MFLLFLFLFFFNVFFFNSIMFVLLNSMILVLLGGVLTLIESKFLSLMQSSVGPNFVGFSGRLQFLADALKLFLKEYMVLSGLNSFMFIFFPSMYLFFLFFFWVLLNWGYNLYFMDMEYSLVLFLLMELFLSFFSLLSGFLSKNKYTIISSSSACYLFFNFEIFFSIFLILVLSFNLNFSFSFFFPYSFECYGFLKFFLILPMIWLFFFLDTHSAPFDLVEAETELMMGFMVEYSSFLFGLYVLGEYMHMFFFCFIYMLFFFV